MTFSKICGIVVGFGSCAILYPIHRLHAKELIDCHECHMKRLPKAKELPLYEKKVDFELEYDESSKLPLISKISVIRQQLFSVASYMSGFKDEVIHIYDTGIAHTQSSFDYLTSEENRIPRILAITSGGLVGYIFARKSGKVKKLLFMTAGTGFVFSVFYPATAKEYASIGWEHTKYHTLNALEKYGGYDTQKLANETNKNIERLKNSLKLEGVTNEMKDWFDKNKEKVMKALNLKTDAKEATDIQDKPTKDTHST